MLLNVVMKFKAVDTQYNTKKTQIKSQACIKFNLLEVIFLFNTENNYFFWENKDFF